MARKLADVAASMNAKVESIDNFDWIFERIQDAIKSKRARSIEMSAHDMTTATMARLTEEGFSYQRQTRPAPTRDDWNAVEAYYTIHW